MPDQSGGCLIDQAAAKVKSGGCLNDQAAARLKSGSCQIEIRQPPDRSGPRFVRSLILGNLLLLHKLKKLRRPYLCQVFTYAGPMPTLIEPNQMILAILIDQFQ